MQLTWAQGGVPEDNLLKQLYWCVLLFSIGVVLTRIDVLVRLYRCVLMCPPEFIDTITQARGQPHNSWSPKLVRNLNIARDYLHQHQHALRRLHCAFKKNRSNQNQHCSSRLTPRAGELVTNLNTTSAFLPIASSLLL